MCVIKHHKMPPHKKTLEEICSSEFWMTDRKRMNFIKELKELYKSEEVTNKIDANSKNESEPTGITWTRIVASVHEILLCEAKSQCLASKSKLQDYSQTMLDTIEKANTFGILVKCEDLMPLVIKIFSDEAFSIWWKTYLTILLKRILPFRQYQANVSSNDWKILLDFAIKFYNDNCDIEKNLILETIHALIKHGCKQSNLALHLKKIIFPFLVEVFQNAAKSVKSDSISLSKNAFNIANAVCEQIGSDSRKAICKFGEEVMRTAIELHSSPAKYDWMLLVVRAHHPGGVTKHHEAAYACNSDAWTDILRFIYKRFIVENDYKGDFWSYSFVQLACEVSWQLKDDGTCLDDVSSSIDEVDYSQPSKRRRIVIDTEGIIDVLIAASRKENYEHPIQILIALITKYPNFIKENNFQTLMEFLIDYSSPHKAVHLSGQFWKLARVVFKLDSKLSRTVADNYSNKWDPMWNIALTSDSIRRNDEQVHKFLQSFIKCKKLNDSDAILNLYLKGTIKWSKPSIQTLLIFCKHNAIRESVKTSTNQNHGQNSNNEQPVKIRLLEWVLAVPQDEWNIQFPIEDTCELLLVLTLKSWHNINQITVPVSDVPVTVSDDSRQLGAKKRPHMKSDINECFESKNLQCAFTNIEQIHLITAFFVDLYDETVVKSIPHTGEVRTDNVSYVEENRCLLIKNLTDVINDRSNLHENVVQLAVVAKIISNLEQLKMVKEDVKNIFGDLVKTILKQTSELISEIVNSGKECTSNKLIDVLESLCLFYKTRYQNNVAVIIQSSTEPEMLENIFRLTDVKHLQHISDKSKIATKNSIKDVSDYWERQGFSKESDKVQGPYALSNEDNIRIKACTVSETFYEMDDDAGKISTLLDPKKYNLKEICDLKMATTILELLVDSKLAFSADNITNRLLGLLKELYSTWHNDSEVARDILNILSKVLVRMKSGDIEVQKKNWIAILDSFHKLLQKNESGPMVYIAFIECLETIGKIDPLFIWTKWNDDDECETPAVEDLLIFIRSPFHVVRLRAIKSLQTMFASNNVNEEWLDKLNILFSKLDAAMNDSIIVEGGEYDETEVKEDERTNRIASILHTMVVIIYSSALFRSKALLTMCVHCAEKGNEFDSIKNVLKRISASLRIEKSTCLVKSDLNYLLTQWLEKSYSLHEFPISLFACESYEQFSKQYVAVIVPIIVQKQGLDHARVFCNKYEIPFKDTIERCFPRLISWLLPHLSIYQSKLPSNFTASEIQLARKVFTELRQTKSDLQDLQEVPALIESNLANVMLSIIERLHDEEYSKKFLSIKINYPSSDLPHFKCQDIDRSFKFLGNNLMGTNRSLVRLLATEKQDVLQQVLLKLKRRIHSVNFDEYKLKALHHYVYFSMMILEEIKEDYFNEIEAFVVRDICYTLVHFVNKSLGFVAEAACGYFLHLLKKILPERHEEIRNNLRLIVNSMTPIVKASKTPHAHNVLTLLIVESNNVLKDAFGRLDSFPADDILFKKMREVHSNSKRKMEQSQSLKNEIDHFLNTRDENTEICSVTELNNLLEKLSKGREELKEMYRRLELEQRFSEDYDSRSLHRLICALIKLTASSDLDISLTAAKCLGELGPANLSTMILQPRKGPTEKLLDPVLSFTYRVLVLLSKFLTHSNVQLFTATSKALYIIMSSFWGRKIFAEGKPKELNSEPSESLQIKYIRPFVTKPSETSDINLPFLFKKTEFNENTEIWTIESDMTYRDWITNFTYEILSCFSDSYLKDLSPVCRANESFCEKILPWIIHLIIHTEQELESVIYNKINKFFKSHFNSNNRGERKENSSAESDKHKKKHFKSVRCMLNVVNFIRSQTPDQRQFEFSYLDVAKAAQYSSAYFTSALYAELWCDSLLKNWPKIEVSTPIDYICETKTEDGKVLQEILKDAYIKIGDPDAIYGCGIFYFQNPSAKLEHYAQFNRWDKVLHTHDVQLSLCNKKATKGLLDALQHSGLQYLLNASLSEINKEEQDVDINHQYECAWRLSDWNMSLSHSQQDSPDRFQDPLTNDYSLFRYQTLRCFHEGDTAGLKTALESARKNAIKTLRNISLESCKTVYPVLTQLQMLREIEEIYSATAENYNLTIEKWKSLDSIGVDDFQYIEPILAQRTILLLEKKKHINNKKANNSVQNFLVDTFLRLAELSQEYGCFQVAARALGSLLKQERLPNETLDIVQYHEAVLASKDGNPDLGRRLLRNLIVKESLKPDIRAQALTTYGNWMAETKSENPQTIIDKYFLASLKCNGEIENPTERSKKVARSMADTQAALAQFADVQYQRLVTHMDSVQFESLRRCSTYTEKVAEKLPASLKADKKRVEQLIKQVSIDKIQAKNIESEKEKYLLLAVEHYIATLQQGDDHDLLIFKLVSLWLDNARLKNLSDLLDEHLKKLPSYKFIPSVPQLAPHINESGDAFSRQIRDLLERCALDHPHHTLPVLLSLMNSYKDDEFKKSKMTPSNPESQDLASKKLIDKLKTTKISQTIEQMEKLADSLIMLANLETERNKFGQSDVPKSQSILRLKKLERILVPTLSIDVKPHKNYDEIIGVVEYGIVYDLVGGMNAPKKITCRCTDGQQRDQLVKGDDDLQQDAVMQQVFTVMNILLRTSKEAIKRKLRVRTYKVVPLSKRSGILEWCANTVPIGKVLEGSNGLHAKYYPEDYKTSECKEKLKIVGKSSNKERLDVFMDCCEHLHPVFHYFFLESFPSPEIWFERRLSYMRSIATTSIIGYILGLGDRHLFNMLIDKSTAEVIHIDFGIAFDQGKILPFPETVPFRLTRDIEAAMGASGIEGVFRRSCEETLTMLRHQRGVIITLLQVLLYHPISSWELTPAKVMDHQKVEVEPSPESQKAPGEQNKLAKRALLQLEQKLRGIEEGSPYSVAGQVEKLIQEARDPVNLSQSYYELQPYL